MWTRDGCQKNRNVVQALFRRAESREPVIEDRNELKAKQRLDARQYHARFFNGLGRHRLEGRPIRGWVRALLHANLESAIGTAATHSRFLLQCDTMIGNAR